MSSEMLVREAMAAYGLGDTEGFLALLDPAVEWLVHAGPPLPFGGLYLGRAGVEARINEYAEYMKVTGVLWSNIIAQDDQVAVYGIATRRSLRTGATETSAFAHWYTVRDGHIIRVEQFFDTASVQRMLDGKPGLLPAAANAASTHEAAGRLAALSSPIEDEEREDFGAVLALYGPAAPPRTITLLEIADPQIEWRSSGFGSLPLGGVCYGREAFARHIASTRELLGAYCMSIESSLQAGDTIALRGSLRLLPEDDSQPEVKWFHALTLREGRIIRCLEIFDSLALSQLLQQPDPPRQ